MKYLIRFHLENGNACETYQDFNDKHELTDFLNDLVSRDNHTFCLVQDGETPFLINMLRVTAVVTSKVDETCKMNMNSSIPTSDQKK